MARKASEVAVHGDPLAAGLNRWSRVAGHMSGHTDPYVSMSNPPGPNSHFRLRRRIRVVAILELADVRCGFGLRQLEDLVVQRREVAGRVGVAGVAAVAVCVVADARDVTAGATVTGAGSELAAGIESMAAAAISAARNAGSAGTTPAAVDTIGVAGAGVQRLALRVAVAGIAC